MTPSLLRRIFEPKSLGLRSGHNGTLCKKEGDVSSESPSRRFLDSDEMYPNPIMSEHKYVIKKQSPFVQPDEVNTSCSLLYLNVFLILSLP